MLDYKLIEAVSAVIQEEGFDKAAQRLHLTQSAVSHRVKLLEEQTGQILLIRTNPPRATPAGRQVLKHFRRVQSLESDLEETLAPTSRNGFTTLTLGLNADSLATWFLDAIHPFLIQEKILLDLRVEDQDITRKLLQSGDVIGCISAESIPFQGCTTQALGIMTYHLAATPAFIRTWFPEGLTREAANKAPAVIFNRRDGLHHKALQSLFPDFSGPFPAHYIPSSEKFVQLITRGHAYGVIPELQCSQALDTGELLECSPAAPLHIPLFWHSWVRQSELLKRCTRVLIDNARAVLVQASTQ